MYLVDTNIWLEILLEQNKSTEAIRFLTSIDSNSLFITDFSVYSMGIIMTRLRKSDVFDQFVQETIVDAGVEVIRIPLEEMTVISAITKRYKLDFDDAYQYALAEKHDLTIISFDSDFDRTERGRASPESVVLSSTE
jgi:predicted nucleic acid-binding protein